MNARRLLAGLVLLPFAAALFVLYPLLALATSAGPNSPNVASISNDNAVGTIAWSGPALAGASENAYATFGGAGTTNYLKALNFGFSIPAGQQIDGVIVEIERKGGINGDTKDSVVKLVKGGTVSGNNNGDTSNFWPGTDTYKTYGSATDLWGLSLTQADINATDFGVVLSAVAASNDSGSEGAVDHIRITVHYSTATTPAASQTKIINIL